MRTLRLLFFGFVCLLWSTPALGQSLLDTLIGEPSSADQVKASGLLPLETVKSSLKEAERRLKEQKKQKHRERLAKRLQKLREEMLRYQGYPKTRHLRRVKELLELRQKIVLQLRQWSDTLLRLQGAYSAREQSLEAWRTALSSYLQARKEFTKEIKKRFPMKKRKLLQKSMKALEKRLGKTRKKVRTITRHLAQLQKALTHNQQELSKARRKMFSPPPLPRQTRKPPPPPAARPPVPRVRKTRRSRRRRRRRRRGRRRAKKVEPPKPVIRVLSAAEKARRKRKQEREKALEQAREKLQRSRFETLRNQGLLLKVRKLDEQVQRKTLRVRLSLLLWTLSVMRETYKSHAAKAEGGVLHHKPLHFDAVLMDQVRNHALKLWNKAPDGLLDGREYLQKKLQSLRSHLGWGMFLLGLLLPVFLLGFGWFLRKLMRRGLQRLEEQAAANPESPLVWRSLRAVVQSLHDLLLWALLVVILLWGIGRLDLDKAWFVLPNALGWSLLLARLLWTLAEELLGQERERRLLLFLEDSVALRLRRVLKLAAWLSLLSLPIHRAVEQMGFPMMFREWLIVLFFGLVLTVLILSALFRSSGVEVEDNEEASPKEHNLVIGFLLSWLYPLLLLVALAIYGMYAWGYHNLASYVGRALTLTFVIGGAAGTIYQLVMLVLKRFLFQKKPSLRNGRIWRAVQVLLSLVLGFGALSLILSAWNVPGGWKALYNLLNYPVLKVQKSQISLLSLFKFVLVFGGALWLSGFLKQKFTEHLYPLLSLKAGGQHAANTVLGYVVIALGVLLGLQAMGLSLGVLAVFAGVIGIGVGFGMQNVANNFISGLLITFGRPIAVGDVIEVGGVTGVVQQISARSTTIETLDSRLILIPNSDIIATQVINWSLGPPYVIAMMRIGVAYDSHTDKVLDALRKVAEEHPAVLSHPEPEVRFEDFGQGALEFLLLAAVSDPRTKWDILSELRIASNRRFQALGIEIAWSEDQAGSSGITGGSSGGGD